MLAMSKKLTARAVALSAIAMMGCSNDSLVAPRRSIASARLDQVAVRPCRAIKGTIESRVTPTGALGVIAGDLEGTITTVLIPEPVGATESSITGTIVHLSGEQTIQVTGGTVPELIGHTLVWTIESRTVVLPPIRRVSNTLTLVDGATGHLVSHGILDTVTHTAVFDYEGEICPNL